MTWQYRHRFRTLLIGAIILFPWCGIMGMADAESGDTQDPGTTSVGKRQGQSPALKPMSKAAPGDTTPVGKRQGQSPALKPSKAASGGTAPVGKRQGQSPALKPSKTAPKDTGANSIPVDDRRQGQSPGTE
ncbi:MAG: hypothetical protein NTAFB01_29120 [Nitrospira sp.]